MRLYQWYAKEVNLWARLWSSLGCITSNNDCSINNDVHYVGQQMLIIVADSGLSNSLGTENIIKEDLLFLSCNLLFQAVLTLALECNFLTRENGI